MCHTQMIEYFGETSDHCEFSKAVDGLVFADNPHLTMHLYDGSNHGFFTDIDGSEEKLKGNARDAIDRVMQILF